MYNVFSITTNSPSSPLISPPGHGRACDGCRRLKIKCTESPDNSSSKRPFSPRHGKRCVQCRRASQVCTYNEPPSKRGRRSKLKGIIGLDIITGWNEPRSYHTSINSPGRAPMEQQSSSLNENGGNPELSPLEQFSRIGNEDEQSHQAGREESTREDGFDDEIYRREDTITMETHPVPTSQNGALWTLHPSTPGIVEADVDDPADSRYEISDDFLPLPHQRPDYDATSAEKSVEQPVARDVENDSPHFFDVEEILFNDLESCSGYRSPPFTGPAQVPTGHNLVPSAKDDFADDVKQFFDTMFIVFPILSRQNVFSRLVCQRGGFYDLSTLILLLSIRMLNAASQLRMNPRCGIPLLDLIREVEHARLRDDFSDEPSLDTVVVSLFLFTAYNVLEKHNRAFLYLDEAFSLMDMAHPPPEEARRRAILKQVLFNTEAATHAIYATTDRKRTARNRWLTPEEQQLVSQGNHEEYNASENIAIYLLKCLNEAHSAESPQALIRLNKDCNADTALLMDAAFQCNSHVKIQAADAAITRQWQLSSKLASPSRTKHQMSTTDNMIIESMGVLAMSWVCLLGDGELRILGLGKLAGLARNICSLTKPGECSYVLSGLAGAVMKGDHEKVFAPGLADLVSMMGAVRGHSCLTMTTRGQDGNDMNGRKEVHGQVSIAADTFGSTSTTTTSTKTGDRLLLDDERRRQEDQEKEDWSWLLRSS